MQQPKPSPSPHAWGTHPSCPTSRAGGTEGLRELQGQNLYSLVTASPSFSPSVPALAPGPVRSSAPPGPVDTVPSAVQTLPGLRAGLSPLPGSCWGTSCKGLGTHPELPAGRLSTGGCTGVSSFLAEKRVGG